MAWNQPGGAEPPKSRRQGKATGAFDALLSRWARRLSGGQGGSKGSPSSPGGAPEFGMLPRLILAALALVWLVSGFYQVGAAERGVVERFGKFQTVTPVGSGIGWHFPWPVETLSKVDVSGISTVEYQSRVLTADVNLVNITCAVQYQNLDALKVLYQVRDREATLREVSESAIREVIGQNSLDAVLAGKSRGAITASTRERIQKTLDTYQSGVRVVAVNLTEVEVPEAVQAAQRDANKAVEDSDRYGKEAQAYANDLVPRARGTAQHELLDAQAYKSQVIARAEGQAARFTQLVGAYTQSPDITRNQIYIETMKTILARSRKVILDTRNGDAKSGGAGNMIYLPLDKLLESGARSTPLGTEVTPPAGGNVNSNAGTAAPPVAAPVAPTSAAAPPAAADSENNDARSRDRSER